MLLTEQLYKCSGCGKEEKGFGFGPFPIRLRDDRSIAKEYTFCDMECLRRWLEHRRMTEVDRVREDIAKTLL